MSRGDEDATSACHVAESDPWAHTNCTSAAMARLVPRNGAMDDDAISVHSDLTGASAITEVVPRTVISSVSGSGKAGDRGESMVHDLRTLTSEEIWGIERTLTASFACDRQDDQGNGMPGVYKQSLQQVFGSRYEPDNIDPAMLQELREHMNDKFYPWFASAFSPHAERGLRTHNAERLSFEAPRVEWARDEDNRQEWQNTWENLKTYLESVDDGSQMFQRAAEMDSRPFQRIQDEMSTLSPEERAVASELLATVTLEKTPEEIQSIFSFDHSSSMPQHSDDGVQTRTRWPLENGDDFTKQLMITFVHAMRMQIETCKSENALTVLERTLETVEADLRTQPQMLESPKTMQVVSRSLRKAFKSADHDKEPAEMLLGLFPLLSATAPMQGNRVHAALVPTADDGRIDGRMQKVPEGLQDHVRNLYPASAKQIREAGLVCWSKERRDGPQILAWLALLWDKVQNCALTWKSQANESQQGTERAKIWLKYAIAKALETLLTCVRDAEATLKLEPSRIFGSYMGQPWEQYFSLRRIGGDDRSSQPLVPRTFMVLFMIGLRVKGVTLDSTRRVTNFVGTINVHLRRSADRTMPERNLRVHISPGVMQQDLGTRITKGATWSYGTPFGTVPDLKVYRVRGDAIEDGMHVLRQAPPPRGTEETYALIVEDIVWQSYIALAKAYTTPVPMRVTFDLRDWPMAKLPAYRSRDQEWFRTYCQLADMLMIAGELQALLRYLLTQMLDAVYLPLPVSKPWADVDHARKEYDQARLRCMLGLNCPMHTRERDRSDPVFVTDEKCLDPQHEKNVVRDHQGATFSLMGAPWTSVMQVDERPLKGMSLTSKPPQLHPHQGAVQSGGAVVVSEEGRTTQTETRNSSATYDAEPTSRLTAGTSTDGKAGSSTGHDWDVVSESTSMREFGMLLRPADASSSEMAARETSPSSGPDDTRTSSMLDTHTATCATMRSQSSPRFTSASSGTTNAAIGSVSAQTATLASSSPSTIPCAETPKLKPSLSLTPTAGIGLPPPSTVTKAKAREDGGAHDPARETDAPSAGADGKAETDSNTSWDITTGNSPSTQQTPLLGAVPENTNALPELFVLSSGTSDIATDVSGTMSWLDVESNRSGFSSAHEWETATSQEVATTPCYSGPNNGDQRPTSGDHGQTSAGPVTENGTTINVKTCGDGAPGDSGAPTEDASVPSAPPSGHAAVFAAQGVVPRLALILRTKVRSVDPVTKVQTQTDGYLAWDMTTSESDMRSCRVPMTSPNSGAGERHLGAFRRLYGSLKIPCALSINDMVGIIWNEGDSAWVTNENGMWTCIWVCSLYAICGDADEEEVRTNLQGATVAEYGAMEIVPTLEELLIALDARCPGTINRDAEAALLRTHMAALDRIENAACTARDRISAQTPAALPSVAEDETLWSEAVKRDAAGFQAEHGRPSFTKSAGPGSVSGGPVARIKAGGSVAPIRVPMPKSTPEAQAKKQPKKVVRTTAKERETVSKEMTRYVESGWGPARDDDMASVSGRSTHTIKDFLTSEAAKERECEETARRYAQRVEEESRRNAIAADKVRKYVESAQRARYAEAQTDGAGVPHAPLETEYVSCVKCNASNRVDKSPSAVSICGNPDCEAMIVSTMTKMPADVLAAHASGVPMTPEAQNWISDPANQTRCISHAHEMMMNSRANSGIDKNFPKRWMCGHTNGMWVDGLVFQRIHERFAHQHPQEGMVSTRVFGVHHVCPVAEGQTAGWDGTPEVQTFHGVHTHWGDVVNETMEVPGRVYRMACDPSLHAFVAVPIDKLPFIRLEQALGGARGDTGATMANARLTDGVKGTVAAEMSDGDLNMKSVGAAVASVLSANTQQAFAYPRMRALAEECVAESLTQMVSLVPPNEMFLRSLKKAVFDVMDVLPGVQKRDVFHESARWAGDIMDVTSDNCLKSMVRLDPSCVLRENTWAAFIPYGAMKSVLRCRNGHRKALTELLKIAGEEGTDEYNSLHDRIHEQVYSFVVRAFTAWPSGVPPPLIKKVRTAYASWDRIRRVVRELQLPTDRDCDGSMIETVVMLHMWVLGHELLPPRDVREALLEISKALDTGVVKPADLREMCSSRIYYKAEKPDERAFVFETLVWALVRTIIPLVAGAVDGMAVKNPIGYEINCHFWHDAPHPVALPAADTNEWMNAMSKSQKGATCVCMWEVASKAWADQMVPYQHGRDATEDDYFRSMWCHELAEKDGKFSVVEVGVQQHPMMMEAIRRHHSGLSNDVYVARQKATELVNTKPGCTRADVDRELRQAHEVVHDLTEQQPVVARRELPAEARANMPHVAATIPNEAAHALGVAVRVTALEMQCVVVHDYLWGEQVRKAWLEVRTAAAFASTRQIKQSSLDPIAPFKMQNNSTRDGQGRQVAYETRMLIPRWLYDENMSPPWPVNLRGFFEHRGLPGLGGPRVLTSDNLLAAINKLELALAAVARGFKPRPEAQGWQPCPMWGAWGGKRTTTPVRAHAAEYTAAEVANMGPGVAHPWTMQSMEVKPQGKMSQYENTWPGRTKGDSTAMVDNRVKHMLAVLDGTAAAPCYGLTPPEGMEYMYPVPPLEGEMREHAPLARQHAPSRWTLMGSFVTGNVDLGEFRNWPEGVETSHDTQGSRRNAINIGDPVASQTLHYMQNLRAYQGIARAFPIYTTTTRLMLPHQVGTSYQGAPAVEFDIPSRDVHDGDPIDRDIAAIGSVGRLEVMRRGLTDTPEVLEPQRGAETKFRVHPLNGSPVAVCCLVCQNTDYGCYMPNVVNFSGDFSIGGCTKVLPKVLPTGNPHLVLDHMMGSWHNERVLSRDHTAVSMPRGNSEMARLRPRREAEMGGAVHMMWLRGTVEELRRVPMGVRYHGANSDEEIFRFNLRVLTKYSFVGGVEVTSLVGTCRVEICGVFHMVTRRHLMWIDFVQLFEDPVGRWLLLSNGRSMTNVELVELLVAVRLMWMLVRPEAIDPVGMLCMEGDERAWFRVMQTWYNDAMRTYDQRTQGRPNWLDRQVMRCVQCEGALFQTTAGNGRITFVCILCTNLTAPHETHRDALLSQSPETVRVDRPAERAAFLEDSRLATRTLVRMYRGFTTENGINRLRLENADTTCFFRVPRVYVGGETQDAVHAGRVHAVRLERGHFGTRMWGSHIVLGHDAPELRCDDRMPAFVKQALQGEREDVRTRRQPSAGSTGAVYASLYENPA